MASRAEKMVKTLAVESRVDYYIGVLQRTRSFYEKTLSTGAYPEKLRRDTLGFIDLVIAKLGRIKALMSRYRFTLQPFYLWEALDEIRNIRFHQEAGAVSTSLARRVGAIVSELEMELRQLAT